MAAWHRSRSADIGLRISGLILCMAAWAGLARLFAMPAPAGIAAFGCAAGGFLCASAGSALALLGAHLFDRIETSARWR